jgi:hypothetical protein
MGVSFEQTEKVVEIELHILSVMLGACTCLLMGCQLMDEKMGYQL